MTDEEEIEAVDDLIANGQRAMEQISQATQAEIDELVTAIAWARTSLTTRVRWRNLR